jgi:hypothetical protein
MTPPPTPDGAQDAGTAPGFGTLLQRYLLPVGLCAQPQGDLFCSHATRAQNLATLKRWMPHYARVHAWLAAALLGVCTGAKAAEVSGWLIAAAAVPTAGEVVLAITFGCVALVLHLGGD